MIFETPQNIAHNDKLQQTQFGAKNENHCLYLKDFETHMSFHLWSKLQVF